MMKEEQVLVLEIIKQILVKEDAMEDFEGIENLILMGLKQPLVSNSEAIIHETLGEKLNMLEKELETQGQLVKITSQFLEEFVENKKNTINEGEKQNPNSDELNFVIHQLAQHKEQASKEIESLKETLVIQKRESEDLQSKISSIQKEKSNAILKIEKDLMDEKNLNEQLKSQFEQLSLTRNKELPYWENELKKKDEQISELKHSIIIHEQKSVISPEANKELEDKNIQIAGLQNQLKTTEEKLDGLLSKESIYKTELSDIQKLQEEKKKEINFLNDEYTQLLSQSTQEKLETEKLRVELMQAQEEITKKNQTTGDSSSELSLEQPIYLQMLQEQLLKNEDNLKQYITSSFCIQYPAFSPLKSCVFWAGEKIGITYLVTLNIDKSDVYASSFALITHQIINSLIIETKLINVNVILDEFYKRTLEVCNSYPVLNEYKVQIGICMIDKLNVNMHFAGKGVNMIIRKGKNTVIRSKELNENIADHKYTHPLQRGTCIYLVSETSDEPFGQRLEQQILSLEEKTFVEHKKYLNQFIENENPTKEIIQIIGFSF